MLSRCLSSSRVACSRALRSVQPLVLRPLAPLATSQRSAVSWTREDNIKASLLEQLKSAHLEGWSEEDVAHALKYDDACHGTHGIDIMDQVNDLSLEVEEIFYNSPPGILYAEAVKDEPGSVITSTGALAVSSGTKMGRSPTEKRVVLEDESKDDIWWGTVNMPVEEHSFLTNRERAVNYLNTLKKIFVVDGFVGWDPEYRLPIRIITSRAYHALFMQNMLVPPKPEELVLFEKGAKEKPFVVFNAGVFPANRQTKGVTSSVSVMLSFKRKEFVILGTQYAGEMKKGCFTVMNYLMPLMPKRDLPPAERALPLHASANIGPDNDVSIFFGLSGTGKTTLSADPKRDLIGDDEHIWSTSGVSNMEGGCYAKCINLTREKEPDVWDAIKYGAVMENVVLDPHTGIVDYDDMSLTENTRVSYPLHHIENARWPAVVPHHPKQVILLTCDAFGVLPPISKLTKEQVVYHFISGYTAKVAGTEVGIIEPVSTFSACFGAPFMVWHPSVYAEMLAAKLEVHDAPCYLVNTGWVGGPYGTGQRCSLKVTRAIIDAIHDGTLKDMEWEQMPIFNLMVPKKSFKEVPMEVLRPEQAWVSSGHGQDKYNEVASKLAQDFVDNFKAFESKATPDVIAAGPKPMM